MARYKKAQKRFEATFGNKKRQSSNSVYAIDGYGREREKRSAAGRVFVTPIDTLTDGFSKSMHQNSDRLNK